MGSLSVNNIVDEVFGSFAATFAEVRKVRFLRCLMHYDGRALTFALSRLKWTSSCRTGARFGLPGPCDPSGPPYATAATLGSKRVSVPYLCEQSGDNADARCRDSTVWHLIVLNLDYTPGKFEGGAAGEMSSVST